MKRVLSLVCVVLASSCWDFDGALKTFEAGLDAGRADAGAGGAGGGSTGGGSAGGGAGGMAGSAGGGAGGGVVMVDAGCAQVLCPEVEFNSRRTSSIFRVIGGVQAESLTAFRVYGSFDVNRFARHYSYLFVDGGVSEFDHNSDFGVANFDAFGLSGVSLDDAWYAYSFATHYVEGVPRDYQQCRLDGGTLTQDNRVYGVRAFSTDEAMLVGYPGQVCLWTSDAGQPLQITDPSAYPNAYLVDAYRKPSGETFVVGGDYANSVGVGLIIDGVTGQRLSAPPIEDSYYTDGYNSIDGIGESVWAVGREDSRNGGNTGTIAALQEDGGFETAFSAPFRLAAIAVAPDGRAFAVGQNPGRIVYFDGGTWGTLALPNTGTRGTLRWEAVAAVRDGLITAGYATAADGGQQMVVNSYRFFGH